MANVRNGNTVYVDTASANLTTNKSVKLWHAIVSATAANAVLVLGDTTASTYASKLDLRVATSGASQQFSFELVPVMFPNGIRVVTATNCVASLIISENQ